MADNVFCIGGFIRSCLDSLDHEDAVLRIRLLLDAALREPEALAAALPADETDEVLVHADERITIVHIQLTPNVHFPPHNHCMPVLIGLYRGAETNIDYTLDIEGNPVPSDIHCIKAPAVSALPPEAIHSVANHGDTRSAALHVYLGDLVRQTRTIWNPRDHSHHPYSDETYFGFVRPFDANKPFHVPETPRVHAEHASAIVQQGMTGGSSH